MSTDTLVHAGSRQRPTRDFVPTVVGDADSAGDSLYWYRGGRPEKERSRKQNETKGSQDGVGGAFRRGFITCQNADNSTVWSQMSADILSHEWPRRRAPGPAKRDSSHSYISATTWTTTTTTTTSGMDYLWLARSQKR